MPAPNVISIPPVAQLKTPSESYKTQTDIYLNTHLIGKYYHPPMEMNQRPFDDVFRIPKHKSD